MTSTFARAFLLLAVSAQAALTQQAGTEARDPRASITVSTAWLADHLKDPDLVLLHVGEKSEYDAGHISGARFVSLQDIAVSGQSSPSGLTLEMPAATDLHDRLANLGIGDKSRVVVYYGKDWVTPSTRVMFTLDYAGLGPRSALLEGGMQQWKRDGHEVTADAPVAPSAGTLSPLRTRPIVVDAAWVNAHLGKKGVSVVDARDTVFYSGTRTGGRAPQEHRTGHIAGAKSVFFNTLFDDKNTLKPPAELRALFAAAGVQPGDTVVTYCHIGQQATATLFAARSLGHPVLLYDGSFEDWSRRSEFPVDNPSKKP
ncbi:MAG TPA: rhodanese-like domain-containing protein [Gemmatimonadaceae bacterium]|nr:rhodanese-like domain-containing protein [Gemmatimonadaceae bacterium]